MNGLDTPSVAQYHASVRIKGPGLQHGAMVRLKGKVTAEEFRSETGWLPVPIRDGWLGSKEWRSRGRQEGSRLRSRERRVSRVCISNHFVSLSISSSTAPV